MPIEQSKSSSSIRDWLTRLLLALPWTEIVAEAWEAVRKLSSSLANSGMYEVLEYEATLELLDKRGEEAVFRKREKVHYLQDNIITYQDQAWGDGDILVGYRCTPGTLVDRYRPGHKTYLLISLRDVKQRGDTDEFYIEWRLQNGFRRATELWETEVSHSTRELKMQVIFPQSRPPQKAWITEYTHRQTKALGQKAKRKLPDGRWLIEWATRQPRLHERYLLQWEW